MQSISRQVKKEKEAVGQTKKKRGRKVKDEVEAVQKNQQKEKRRKKRAEESRRKGIPRPVSAEFNLVDVESRGPRLILTYQFAHEFTRRISDSDKREIINEVERNFRNSAFCNSPEMRSMLAGGLAITQIYTPLGSSENVATIRLGIRNCPRL